MTLSSQTSKNVFVGDAVTVLFTYTFRIFADADLLVTIQDTSVTPQTEITLVLTSDYTVTGAGDASGGTITLLLTGQLSTAPIATDNITIQRALPITQPTDYVENDPFPATSHEDALDRGRMIDQQLQEELDRCLKIAVNITGVSVTLPTPVADEILGWNSAGDAIVNISQSTIAGSSIAFIDHSDTPAAYAGSALDFVRVNAGATAVEFVTPTYALISAGDGATDVTGTELETLTDGSNADALHVHAGAGETNSLEVLTTGIASTQIPIGTAVDTVVYAALSGDVTMDNAGVVSVSDFSLAGQALDDIAVFDGSNWVAQAPAGGAVQADMRTITRNTADAPNSVAFTGIGFQPTALVVNGNRSSQAGGLTVGMASGASNEGTIYADEPTFTNSFSLTGGFISRLIQSSGVVTFASLDSFDADGYTIAFTKSGAPSGSLQMQILALR